MSATPATDLESGKEVISSAQEKVHDDRIVDWDGPDDSNNPRNWPAVKRHLHVVLVSVFTLYGNLASTMFAPAAAQLVADFAITSEILAAFTVSIYMMVGDFTLTSGKCGLIIHGPLSEIYGRVIIIHICNVMFVAFTVGCALSTNSSMFFAFRFLAGCAFAAPMTVGGGVIADVTPQEKRGKAMAIWAMGPLLGPVIGPVIGGLVAARLSWRWTFWIIAILAGTFCTIGVVCMRESNATILLRRKASRLRNETGNMQLKAKGDTGKTPRQELLRAIIRPTRLLLFSPIVTLFSLYAAVVFGFIFLLFTTFPSVFEIQYEFSTETSGLSYLGLGIGFFIGLALFGSFSDKVVQKLRGAKEATPEMRLPLMMWISPIIVVGFFWYGWSAQARVHWIVPILGTSLIGIGSLFVMMPSQIYLVDAFGPESAASALAANTVLRTLAGAFLTLAGPPLYSSLGIGWGNSLLGLMCLLFVPVPFLFYRYGKWLRERFVFQP
ncbi:major facilitator superfamily domain-containing protein [Xylariales sp. AK1849]|nr:major facilitator superfamily domain-containing protein [Xylariales sp. AK1849]